MIARDTITLLGTQQQHLLRTLGGEISAPFFFLVTGALLREERVWKGSHSIGRACSAFQVRSGHPARSPGTPQEDLVSSASSPGEPWSVTVDMGRRRELREQRSEDGGGILVASRWPRFLQHPPLLLSFSPVRGAPLDFGVRQKRMTLPFLPSPCQGRRARGIMERWSSSGPRRDPPPSLPPTLGEGDPPPNSR